MPEIGPDRPIYEVLGMGSASIDYIIPIKEDFLKDLAGEKGGAQAVTLEELNQILQHSESKPHMAVGGSCTNTIKGLAHLGASCALLSQIGTDPFGHYLYERLARMGIRPLFVKSSKPTLQVLCLVTPDGQRTMRFLESSVCDQLEASIHSDDLQGVKIIHIEAYFLRHGHAVEKMVELAQERKILVSLDLSSFEIVQKYERRLYDLLSQNIDLLFANKDEIYALTALPPHEGCLQLQNLCSTVVALMGPEGCLVGHQRKVMHVPTHFAPVVDTTGAGDLFASGFLYGILKGYSLEKCADLGNRLGGMVIGIPGTDIPEEKWQSVRNNLEKQPF